MYETREIQPPADLASEADIQAAECHYLELLATNCVAHIAWPLSIIRVVGRRIPDVGDAEEFRQISRGLWALLIPHKYSADVVERAGLPAQGNKRFIDQLAADYFVQVGLVSSSAFIASARMLALIAHIFSDYGRDNWPTYMPWHVNIPAHFAAPEYIPLDRLGMSATLPDAARAALRALQAGQSHTFGSAPGGLPVQATSDRSSMNIGINLIINETIGCFVHVSGCAGYGPGAFSCLHIPPLSPIVVRRQAYLAKSPEKERQ